jgi:tetratricopeptide (TPR) repeat protein
MLGVAAQPLFPARVASAQVESSEAIQRARELFKKSAQSYREGKLEEAIDLLNEAYRLDPKPVLLYNLARAYEGLGDTPRAIEGYRRYLEEDPAAADRGALEQRIATLERQQREREALERAAAERAAAPKEKSAAPAPDQAGGPSPAPWVVAGIGAAGVGAGLVLGALARGRHEDAVSEDSALRALELQSQAESWATGATVALIVGGAVAAGGVIWGIVDLTSQGRSEPAASRPRVRLGLLGLSVVVQGRL